MNKKHMKILPLCSKLHSIAYVFPDLPAVFPHAACVMLWPAFSLDASQVDQCSKPETNTCVRITK